MNRSRQRRLSSAAPRTLRAVGAEQVAAAGFLRERLPGRPGLAVVLGSGFADLLKSLPLEQTIPFAEVPGLVSGAVDGHPGAFVVGRVHRESVLFLAGRAHLYEGFSAAEVARPMRVLAALGVGLVLLTNAAGGIHPQLTPGRFMIIRDHINFQGVNPLTGLPFPGLERFVDLSCVYDRELRALLRRAAAAAGLEARQGVYLAVAGPSFETPAEIRAFRRLGADAVGMSTVAEAIVARQCGLRVAGLSLIANRAAGLSRGALSHAEVLACGRAAGTDAGRLIGEFVRLVSAGGGAARAGRGSRQCPRPANRQEDGR
jgi:inosine/guanosine/xanthosine phosphorylase family protein